MKGQDVTAMTGMALVALVAGGAPTWAGTIPSIPDNLIAKHYAGPTWESNDGSKVVGEVKAKDNGPDPNAIPWLALSAKSTSGPGVFSQVKSIQRVDTVGGKAPNEACSQSQAGKVARVGYKATYNFYVAKP